eukprot:EG_transcript_19098
MSHSKTGTRTTKDFIDRDSSKYVERSDLGFSKRGDASSGTDSAHKLSWGLAQTIITHTPGRPMGDDRYEEFARDMNDSSNLRMKSSYGNRVLDERRDARIADAFVNGKEIQGDTTANRAYQAYKAASSYATMDALADQLGEMKVSNPETGRSHKLKNHDKFQ